MPTYWIILPIHSVQYRIGQILICIRQKHLTFLALPLYALQISITLSITSFTFMLLSHSKIIWKINGISYQDKKMLFVQKMQTLVFMKASGSLSTTSSRRCPQLPFLLEFFSKFWRKKLERLLFACFKSNTFYQKNVAELPHAVSKLNFINCQLFLLLLERPFGSSARYVLLLAVTLLMDSSNR